MLRTCSRLLSLRAPSVTQTRGTVIVERWWKIPLAKEGEEPYLHPRRHRIYRLLEDTKHSPKEKMQLILTQNVHQLGSRGDTVLVDKRRGRNKLLAQGLAVYASPENKEIFEEERKMQQAGELGGRKQTWTGEMTVNYLKKSRLTVEMKTNIQWQLNEEIVTRHLLKSLGVVAPAHAVKIPDEPITMFGEYWCEVTVNGLDTVRMPMDVVNYMSMRTKRYNHWLSKQANTAGSPAEGDVTTETPAEDNVATETPAEGNVCESPPEGSTSPKSTS
ncbi:large ribosomal subunit protein bL9m isoform 1-T1 [Anomaloglossus baeobatrachus]|uniref:large ribosomal subunit protein bL9m isoform X1 n=1 Tax=Anomaloglossus baeobatrachus TaxID=238106 RepID=UPI003F50020D